MTYTNCYHQFNCVSGHNWKQVICECSSIDELHYKLFLTILAKFHLPSSVLLWVGEALLPLFVLLSQTISLSCTMYMELNQHPNNITEYAKSMIIYHRYIGFPQVWCVVWHTCSHSKPCSTQTSVNVVCDSAGRCVRPAVVGRYSMRAILVYT